MLNKKNKSTIANGRKKRRLFKSEKRKDHKALYIVIGALAVLIALFVLGITTSLKIRTSSYIIEYGNLPDSFDGYKIVQLTDYHKRIYANDNAELIEKVKELEPDLIALTGDIIDSSNEDIDDISELVDSLVDIAPVIWVRGNHYYKADSEVAEMLQEEMDSLGVISLVNECYTISKEAESIMLCGVDDPERLYSSKDLPTEYTKTASKKAMERFLDEVDESAEEDSWFKILLTHRYSVYENYSEHGYSLAIAGHSHGGQIKLPWGIDFIGYDLKLFPSVKSGYNDIGGMPLIVSSGLGTSNLNLRLYNPPEIVFIELKSK